MRKDRNRNSASKVDHSLPRGRILRSKRDFQQLFESSSALHSGSLMFIYRLYTDPSKGIKTGFSTPKKTFRRAVDRNRMKRRMREVYRIRQHIIDESISLHGGGIHGLIILKKEISFPELDSDMQSLLEKAAKMIRKSDSVRAPSRETESLES